jgi:hypothetical protein
MKIFNITTRDLERNRVVFGTQIGFDGKFRGATWRFLRLMMVESVKNLHICHFLARNLPKLFEGACACPDKARIDAR